MRRHRRAVAGPLRPRSIVLIGRYVAAAVLGLCFLASTWTAVAGSGGPRCMQPGRPPTRVSAIDQCIGERPEIGMVLFAAGLAVSTAVWVAARLVRAMAGSGFVIVWFR